MDVLSEKDWRFFSGLFIGLVGVCVSLMEMAVGGQIVWRIAGIVFAICGIFSLCKWWRAVPLC